jgi:hypothetical protein
MLFFEKVSIQSYRMLFVTISVTTRRMELRGFAKQGEQSCAYLPGMEKKHCLFA